DVESAVRKRVGPVDRPGEVWVTAEVAGLAGKGPQEFWFEGLAGASATDPGGALAFRAHWRKDEGWVKRGTVLPLGDEQGDARFAAMRRFAVLWLLLDQLPRGSWGRSTAAWMDRVWADIPSMPFNPVIEDEGGFETTILNLHTLYQLFGQKCLS